VLRLFALRKCRELIDGILVTHGLIALAADRPKVVDVGRATFALWQIVAAFKLKRRHDVFTPRHKAFVFKEPVAAPQEPHLLTESARDFGLHE
jgi:hypothetical protein